jgi:hypothetical protein
VISEREDGELVTRAGDFTTNEGAYALPPYAGEVPGFPQDLRTVDLRDGSLDSRWNGVDLNDPSNVRHSPVWVRYQTRVLEAIISREGFGRDRITDLFFVNYKEIDDAGHNWNMLAPQTRDVLNEADRMLGRLERSLNRFVGRKRWVIALTADHGQAPLPRKIGAWPIRMREMTADLTRHFGADLIAEERPTGLWLDLAALRRHRVTQEDVSAWVYDYRLRDNAGGTEPVPRPYRRQMHERVFSAGFPGRRLGKIWSCAQRAGT